MDGSPPKASSPAYPPSQQIPRKRPSLNTGLSEVKRRKPSSSAASSAHPLRQTSFPPPDHIGSSRASSFSPTVDGSVAGRSSVTGGKRKKNKTTDGQSTAASSVKGAKTASIGKESRTKSNNATAEDEDQDEEDDADEAIDTVLEGGMTTNEAQEKLERENMQMLMQAFSQDQLDRYEMWRRVRLKKETVRRIINQTLSQSVPDSIRTTVNGYTKLFVGELIERAKDVQAEWLAASSTLPTGEPKDGGETISDIPANGIKSEFDSATANSPSDSDGKTASSISERYDVKERDKGPLTPDHLREALRRYKKDREGGGAGFHGLSLHGKTNVASRVGGRRLFR